MIQFFYKVLTFVRTHKVAFGVGGGAIAVATTVSLVRRGRAAAVGEKVVEKMKSVLGVPYVWGSNDPLRGLDCSGAVVWVLRRLGLKPSKWDATAASLRKESSLVILPQVGDLVFYGPLLGSVNHVMVYMGDGKVIGASGGGSMTKTAEEARAKGAEVKILPVDYRKDFRGYGRLSLGPVREEAVGGLHMLGARR